jgi:hypothetical protein
LLVHDNETPCQEFEQPEMYMELILFAMITLIVIVAFLAVKLNNNSFPFPFDSKSALFTPAEKNFQNLLEQALGSHYRIINRVKLSDLVKIRGGVSSRASQTASNNADNKYLDFVICDRKSMKLLGVIDLVDLQGKGYKVKKDWFVNGALEAASIPHLRIKVKNNYTVEDIKNCISSKIFTNIPAAIPKIRGRTIPAPMLKARSKKTLNTGVMSPSAVQGHMQPTSLSH